MEAYVKERERGRAGGRGGGGRGGKGELLTRLMKPAEPPE
jgi:hypothetical protein